MKREVAEAWIKDLRSGPKQGQNFLGDETTGHCCLGRLCVVLGVEFDPKGIHLPPKAREAAEMKSGTGWYGHENHLTNDNDSGLTFAEIADIIEAHWEEL